METYTKQININCSVNDLKTDIANTEDPIKKTILERFLDIKLKQIKDQENDNKIRVINKRYTDNKINKILSTQQASLNMLERINNIKSKDANIVNKKKINDVNVLNSSRGTNESKWNTIHDPKYVKYMKEDIMNNRVMERLNSEIDFIHEGCNKTVIEKPFDNIDTDINDNYV